MKITQQQPPRSKLSFDGHGINGSDEYRTRIATFSTEDDAKKYGPLFAAAPELLEALKECEYALHVSIKMGTANHLQIDAHNAAIDALELVRAKLFR